MKRREFLKIVPPAVAGAALLPIIMKQSTVEKLVEQPVTLGVSHRGVHLDGSEGKWLSRKFAQRKYLGFSSDEIEHMNRALHEEFLI